MEVESAERFTDIGNLTEQLFTRHSRSHELHAPKNRRFRQPSLRRRWPPKPQLAHDLKMDVVFGRIVDDSRLKISSPAIIRDPGLSLSVGQTLRVNDAEPVRNVFTKRQTPTRIGFACNQNWVRSPCCQAEYVTGGLFKHSRESLSQQGPELFRDNFQFFPRNLLKSSARQAQRNDVFFGERRVRREFHPQTIQRPCHMCSY